MQIFFVMDHNVMEFIFTFMYTEYKNYLFQTEKAFCSHPNNEYQGRVTSIKCTPIYDYLTVDGSMPEHIMCPCK